MLDKLRLSTFTPLIGDTFTLTLDDGAFDMTLKEAAFTPTFKKAESDVDESGRRVQFTLLFDAPRDPLLPQRVYHIEHATFGALDVFIVPVARDDKGSQYEVVFA